MFRKSLFILLIPVLVLVSCSGKQNEDSYTGVVEGTSVQIPALTGGKILQLFTDTGKEVQPGQVVAQIDTLDLSYQRQQVEASLEELSIQEAIATTNLNRSRNDMQYVQETYDRYVRLHEAQSVTQQVVDDFKNRLQNAEAAYKAAQQQVESISARKKQLTAQLDIVDKKISDASVTSPIGGTIASKYFEAGEAAPPLTPVFEVIDTREMWIKIYVAETTLPQIKVGQEAKIAVDGSSKTLTGRVSWISPKAEFTPKTILTPQTRTALVYAVKITIPNPDGILKQGMPIEVTI